MHKTSFYDMCHIRIMKVMIMIMKLMNTWLFIYLECVFLLVTFFFHFTFLFYFLAQLSKVYD